jgi:hypothetical protein
MRNKPRKLSDYDIVLLGVAMRIGPGEMKKIIDDGMKALSFRIEKLMPRSKWSKKSLDKEE